MPPIEETEPLSVSTVATLERQFIYWPSPYKECLIRLLTALRRRDHEIRQLWYWLGVRGKIKQTKFGPQEGNCYPVCISVLTGIQLEMIPNFCTEDLWFANSVSWLHTRGFSVVYLEGSPAYTSFPYIATGKSPRGDFYHSVIMNAGALLHDPHPDGTGIIGEPSWCLCIMPQAMVR
jgi:hypothetical protein